MVGKAKFRIHDWARKFSRSTSYDHSDSQDSADRHGHHHHKRHHHRHQSHDEPVFKRLNRHVPLIASPLDPKATEWLQKKHEQGNLTLRRRPTIAQFEAERIAGGIFRKQHEATTLELFFDLFFVANLAVFTNNHQHTSATSLGHYVGFFTILWFTWFHISIFDVRFYVDSVFNRFCKVVSFGVFTAFNGLGPVYDVLISGTGTSRAFHGIAMVLMTSRLLLVLQHITVLWFVREFKKTVVPLSLMIAVYTASALGFLATYLASPRGPGVDARIGLQHVLTWYGILAAESVIVIVISSVWRILSFKYTHLVERIGLLTLIIMGEGIIGLTKSVAYTLSGTNISVWDIFGKVVAAVLLIYEIYLLYFSPIDHDRFGTIRQQIWTLLHYPLHVAILLTGEGSSVMLLWDAVMDARRWWRREFPDFRAPSASFTSSEQFVGFVNESMVNTSIRFHYTTLRRFYNWDNELYRLGNITAPFNSSAWDSSATTILEQMYVNTTNFFFENFRFEMSSSMRYNPDPYAKQAASYKAGRVAYTFFYAACGSILLTMAVMYWIGKRNKSKEEWAAIITRLIVGFSVPIAILGAFLDRSEEGFMYQQSGWIVPIATFALLFVVLVDNHINSWVDKKHDEYEEDHEDGTRTEKQHKDHRYGALHGHHADAQAAALHFGKPASFAHQGGAHSRNASTDWTQTQSRSQSRNPSRRPSVAFEEPRNMNATVDDDDERQPFVHGAIFHPGQADDNVRQSTDTAPQLPMPSPLSILNSNYTSYMPAPTEPPAVQTSQLHTQSENQSVRRVQLYEPTMVTPSSMESGHGWQTKRGPNEA